MTNTNVVRLNVAERYAFVALGTLCAATPVLLAHSLARPFLESGRDPRATALLLFIQMLGGLALLSVAFRPGTRLAATETVKTADKVYSRFDVASIGFEDLRKLSDDIGSEAYQLRSDRTTKLKLEAISLRLRRAGYALQATGERKEIDSETVDQLVLQVARIDAEDPEWSPTTEESAYVRESYLTRAECWLQGAFKALEDRGTYVTSGDCERWELGALRDQEAESLEPLPSELGHMAEVAGDGHTHVEHGDYECAPVLSLSSKQLRENTTC